MGLFCWAEQWSLFLKTASEEFVSCAVTRSLQEPSVQGFCTQHHLICCHSERKFETNHVWSPEKNCSWCHQLHHVYKDWECEIWPKGIFMNLALICTFYSFSFECRVVLCASCVLLAHTECLAEPTAVFIPKSPSSLYEPSLALSFQLLLGLCVWHPSPLTGFDPWGGGSKSGDPHGSLLCLCSVPARPMGHWWIPESFKAFHKRIPWKVRFAALRILCLVEQERKDSSEVDPFVLQWIFHKIDKILF